MRATLTLLLGLLSWLPLPAAADAAQRRPWYGDLHIHTAFSMDAFMAGQVRTGPDVAYRYARGESIPHPNGELLRLPGPPLDFLMVADHAGFLGVNAALLDPTSPGYGHPDSEALLRRMPLPELIRELRTRAAKNDPLLADAVIEDAWQKTIAAAERHYAPGRFTTFIGYEYTPTPGSRHLHRNVVFRDGEDKVPARPFSARDSGDPADLWAWLDGLREQGIDALAIPHNMNQSDGLAFQRTTFTGEPIDRSYASRRQRNEPIAEISQIKGTSETHPSLSPNDEWAGFQIVRYYLNRAANTNPISVFKGGYWRDALNTGLALRQALGVNPYQLGAIGSSDSHLSAGSYDEHAYFSGGAGTPQSRGSVLPDDSSSWEGVFTPRQATHGSGGLAGIWAAENTREALFDAMRRRETFATSGPRLAVRLFASHRYPDDIARAPDRIARAYAQGVPMGGVLYSPPEAEAPRLLAMALRDPRSGWLQRLQIVKGWVREGITQEAVYDVACSDGLTPDLITHRCPDNGASVNLEDCSVSRHRGAVELAALWQDPNWRAEEPAYYYARVLENPSCRWSTWDAIRSRQPPNPELPPTHQERAWSSPVWVRPPR